MHSGGILEHDPDESASLKVSRSGGPASGSPLRVFLPSTFVYPYGNVNFPEMIEIPFSPHRKRLTKLTVMEQFTAK